ncbi:PGF-CTERM protein [Halogranum gelatinilyticum]|uniref:PGF-CTERM protein n=1 Tax=Halogranum gelatinilyticum TaxID=660521 RepID=A0A1G9P518_9EURY|nr:PGF-CTERM sorting domain-containing protein [Halogranum gelatinilyticum]SDL93285.1 PGF-CTERM protein [Halogranum gelatinilyticum]
MPYLRRSAALVAAVLLVTGGLAGPVAAQSSATDTGDASLVVDLRTDGSATVTLVRGFDLTTDAERTAFERVRANESAQATMQARFADRMGSVARTLAAETGRETGVRDAGTTVTVEGDTGIVALSVDWDGLAVVDGDRLVLAEPFADGFAFDGAVSVRAPDGYGLVESTPVPAEESDEVATWPGDGLDGYRAVFAPDGTDRAGTADATTSTTSPGFGVLAGVVALLGLLALASARRR